MNDRAIPMSLLVAATILTALVWLLSLLPALVP
jgi:hypothetical protein